MRLSALGIRASHVLCLLLGISTLMAAACEADPPMVFPRGRGGAGDGDPTAGGDPKKGATPNGSGYDPQAPTNTGPQLNPTGFAAIAPLVQTHCGECHSEKAENLKGNLRLDARDGIRLGGDTGPVILPGQPDKSPLIRAVRYRDKDLQMPPEGSSPMR